MAVLGVTFVLRAIGDVDGPESTSVLTWLSPFGWAQATAAYVDDEVLAAGHRVRRHVPRSSWSRSGSSGVATSARASWPSGSDGLASAPASLTGMVALTPRRQLGAILSWGFARRADGSARRAARGRARRLHRLATRRSQTCSRRARTEPLPVRSLSTRSSSAMTTGRVRGDRARRRARGGEWRRAGAAVLALPVSRWRWLGSQVGVAAVASVVIMLAHRSWSWASTAASSLDGGVDVWERGRCRGRDAPGDRLRARPRGPARRPGASRVRARLGVRRPTCSSSGMFGAILPDGTDALSPFTYTPQLPGRGHGLAARARPHARRRAAGRRPGWRRSAVATWSAESRHSGAGDAVPRRCLGRLPTSGKGSGTTNQGGHPMSDTGPHGGDPTQPGGRPCVGSDGWHTRPCRRPPGPRHGRAAGTGRATPPGDRRSSLDPQTGPTAAIVPRIGRRPPAGDEPPADEPKERPRWLRAQRSSASSCSSSPRSSSGSSPPTGPTTSSPPAVASTVLLPSPTPTLEPVARTATTAFARRCRARCCSTRSRRPRRTPHVGRGRCARGLHRDVHRRRRGHGDRERRPVGDPGRGDGVRRDPRRDAARRARAPEPRPRPPSPTPRRFPSPVR